MTKTKTARRNAPRRAAGLLALIVPALLLSGCTGAIPSPAASTNAPGWTSGYVAAAATETAPLTGLTVAAGSSAHPSLAAKVDNHSAARPQVAIDRTDLVFEELVEGGITRYVAVWQSSIPDQVGPVRSIRPMDPDIIAPFGGLVAFSGGQQRFVDAMNATGQVSAIFDYDTTGLFSRSKATAAPHNVILAASEFVNRNASVAPPAQQYAYAATLAGASAVVDGAPISAINTRFSNSSARSWTWNAEAAAYLRAQDGAPDLTADGAQLKATNVVVLRVNVSVDQSIPKTELIASGEASISSGGKTLAATWSKTSQGMPIRLVDANGVTIRLAPGNTWFQLVPNGTGSADLIP
ncbi:DUF3048 domain-containing protein [Cryobacterium sp. TMT1-3]|uniref:DUF3048 domain-containing protein n=1 Tax=Cryobacterium luteum TaxID=1424661 RepID=A0A1H8LB89_9MICO|nr:MULTISPECIES: DUF3048 domain-containing protein [Cryobacterium]TFB82622.1 DUF3048 domain-containing protein [Cryobacterium luteum]TFC30709.1 DUF3048 domain-containing protein [Cryobacterium sp. TMT1-3]SEO02440.1 Protein of unknown function [Cryobacterium luteum]